MKTFAAWLKGQGNPRPQAASALASVVSGCIKYEGPEIISGDGSNDGPGIQAILDGKAVIGPDGKILQGEMIDGKLVVTLPAGITFNIGPSSRIVGRNVVLAQIERRLEP